MQVLNNDRFKNQAEACFCRFRPQIFVTTSTTLKLLSFILEMQLKTSLLAIVLSVLFTSALVIALVSLLPQYLALGQWKSDAVSAMKEATNSIQLIDASKYADLLTVRYTQVQDHMNLFYNASLSALNHNQAVSDT